MKKERQWDRRRKCYTNVFDVEVKGDHFHSVPTVCSPKCKNFQNCELDNTIVLRPLDCERRATRIKQIYNLITGGILAGIAIGIFFYLELGMLKGSGVLLLAFVGMDVLCTVGEKGVEQLRETLFYNQLKKQQRQKQEVEEKALQEIQAQKAAERAAEQKRLEKEKQEQMQKNPEYQHIVEAESYVRKLKELSDRYDFGENEENINQCVEILTDIVELLKQDGTRYRRVSFIFQTYLPEFYALLTNYADFIKAEMVEEKHVEILTKCVDKFLQFLQQQKREATIDKMTTELQFKANAEAFGNLIDMRSETPWK